MSIDTSQVNKISFKIVVNDFGIVANRNTIKKDLDEYISKIKNGDPLDDLPEVIPPIEHSKIITALKNRIVFLQQNYQIEKNIRSFYDDFFQKIPLGSISHMPPPIFNINSRDANMDQRKYTADHSPNAMQGDNHQNRLENVKVAIGSTYSEKKNQITGLDQLSNLLKEDGTSDSLKAARHIENAKEEIEENEVPDKNIIENWLSRAGNVIKLAKTGKEVLEKAKEVFDAFGLPF